ncbi:CinA family protein [Yoonia sp. 208BN28-4]|uniref:CinA family protein n=1 Tax=Yoonia sp. 208BN28-4 TaxID=3126505 RepID=UPI0030B56A21
MTAQLAQDVLTACKAKGVMIATAESCTGGLIAGALTDIAGSSAVFDRGFVTYSNAAKVDMLGVDANAIADHGAVSPQVAAQMAMGALNRSQATVAISVTGVAGPGGTAAKPEGMVCFGIATAKGHHTETMQFGAIGRHEVRRATVAHALSMMLAQVDSLSAKN